MIIDQSYFLPSDEPIPPSAFVSIVRNGCICENGGEPVDGYIHISPACLWHGVRTRYIPQPAMREPKRVRTQSNGKTRGRD
jgi:hypothetical protein